MTIDYLYWFPSEEDCDLPPEAEGECRLSVALVSKEADDDAPREVLPGYYVLSSVADFAEPVCAIERETGRIDVDDLMLEGVRIDPVWAGSAAHLSYRPDIAVEPDPEDISDRQFAQQLAILGTITETEAIGWAARGDLPAALEAAVSMLPFGEHFSAHMLLSSATSYRFSHPLAAALGAMLGFDESARRQLWQAAALL